LAGHESPPVFIENWQSLLGLAVACVELGGTSCAVAIADKIGSFVWKKRGIPTASPLLPSAVISSIADALKSSGYQFDIIGVASFGPLNLVKGSFGNTAKPGWSHFPLLSEFQQYFPEARIVLETDVNARAYSEYLSVRDRLPRNYAVAHLTIGSGVGFRVYGDGCACQWLHFPEFGDLPVSRYPGDAFEGTCPCHGGGCLEGLISADALAERLGVEAPELAAVRTDDPVWDLLGFYIGQVAVNVVLGYSVDCLLVGGAIMPGEGRVAFCAKATEYCSRLLNGYVQPPIISALEYQKDGGLVGASALALHPEIFGK
jgi:fructokinase